MPSSTLPSIPNLVTSIISSLSNLPTSSDEATTATLIPDRHLSSTTSEPPSNSLRALPTQSQFSARSLLSTLHVIFPHELIPALDLLDRTLVTELILVSSDLDTAQRERKPTTQQRDQPSIFYVRSASSASSIPPSRGRPASSYGHSGIYNPETPSYTVHLSSWNCSCPAFAFSAFGRSLNLSSTPPDHGSQDPDFSNPLNEDENVEWRFGGTLTQQGDGMGIGTPVCKHVLAVALAKHGGEVFSGGCERRELGVEEMAGWGGGWGS